MISRYVEKMHSADVNEGSDNTRRCDYCGSEAPLVWVHGHGQCANCGINVDECCRGEQD